MAAPIDLRELALRENERTEWTESVADIDDVVATLSAFANDLQNLGGGYVVCGARESRDEHGFPTRVRIGLPANRLNELEGTILTWCRERVSPPIAPRVDEIEADDPERRILVFTQPATGTMHTLRRGHDGATHFVRIGRSTVEARNGLWRDLLVRKGPLEPWDRRPCSAARVNDLDLLALRDALQRIGRFAPDRGVEPYLADGVQISPLVPSLCVAEPRSGVLRPRNYALLLFGVEPQRFIPGAFTIHSAYPGVDRASPVATRSELAGTLLDQARRLDQLLAGEVVTRFDKTDRTTPNAEKYPRRALLEAMGNALAHRDYELVDPARITSYRDRIEFVSPGTLPVGISLDDLRTGHVAPRWRNQAVAWFLSRLQLDQAEGQGIQTIRSAMQAARCPPPIFDASEVSVTCVLRAHPRFERASRPRQPSARRPRRGGPARRRRSGTARPGKLGHRPAVSFSPSDRRRARLTPSRGAVRRPRPR